MRKSSSPRDPDSFKAAYFRALRWLTARELSEAQVRARLAQRGYSPSAIDPAVERLLNDRTLDDRRAAAAVARTEGRVRRHGPRRVLGKLLAMQFDRDLARDVVRELFADEHERGLLETALDRRVRGNLQKLRDPAERRKLIAYLVRQGFSAGDAAAAIRRRVQ